MIFDILFIFIGHLIPLISVFFFSMNVANVLFIYWIESVFLNVFSSYKMKALKLYCFETGKIPNEDTVDHYFASGSGYKPPILSYEGKGSKRLPSSQKFDVFIAKLLFPNKLFLAVHGLILIYILTVGLNFNFSFQNMYSLVLSVFLILLRQFFVFRSFLNDKDMQKKSSFKQLHFEPNFRLAGLHITIIFGIFVMAYGFNSSSFAIILVLWEIFTDSMYLLFRWRREKKLELSSK